VFSTHLLSPSVSWHNAGLYWGLAYGPTKRPVPPGMKQALAPLHTMELLTYLLSFLQVVGLCTADGDEKSAQRRRKHCALAVVRRSQKNLLRRRPPSPGQNVISWRWSLPIPTNPVCLGSMHVISSYCGNRPTNTHIHTPPTK